MKRINYYGSALLMLLLTFNSCNNANQMETVEEENAIVTKDVLQTSQEYENFRDNHLAT